MFSSVVICCIHTRNLIYYRYILNKKGTYQNPPYCNSEDTRSLRFWKSRPWNLRGRCTKFVRSPSPGHRLLTPGGGSWAGGGWQLQCDLGMLADLDVEWLEVRRNCRDHCGSKGLMLRNKVSAEKRVAVVECVTQLWGFNESTDSSG